MVMSERMMFSTRMRALSTLPTSSSCAMTRRCVLPRASSRCCTMRKRAMASLSWTFSLFWW